VQELSKRRIGSKVLTGQGAQIDTTTPAGRMIFGIFATLAEFERDLIRERTVAGLAAARARGRKGGRRFALTKVQVRLAQAVMASAILRSRRYAANLEFSASRSTATSGPTACSGPMAKGFWATAKSLRTAPHDPWSARPAAKNTGNTNCSGVFPQPDNGRGERLAAFGRGGLTERAISSRMVHLAGISLVLLVRVILIVIETTRSHTVSNTRTGIGADPSYDAACVSRTDLRILCWNCSIRSGRYLRAGCLAVSGCSNAA
jgi:hypothetical protein